ncbi:MAG: hypothetical protein COB02_12995 [Candidatus Cloacimonadota bacterium]|nr:MAG: hypothetical protein COB02_12995 [Candidatus Cloacimonadota bacterium]
MLSIFKRFGVLGLFICFFSYFLFYKSMRQYYGYEEHETFSTISLLNDYSNSDLNSVWNDWIEKVKKLDSNKKSKPISKQDWKILNKYHALLKDYDVDDLDELPCYNIEGQMKSLNLRELKYLILFLSEQLVLDKTKNPSVNYSNLIATLLKLPIIVEKLTPILIGKMVGSSMYSKVISLCHNLYLQNKLNQNEKREILKQLDIYLEKQRSIQDVVKAETLGSDHYLMLKKRQYPIYCFIIKLINGDARSEFKKTMSNPKLLSWNNNKLSEEALKLPVFAMNLLPNYAGAQDKLNTRLIETKLLKCELDVNYEVDSHIQVEIKNNIRYCTSDKDYLRFSKENDRLKLKKVYLN